MLTSRKEWRTFDQGTEVVGWTSSVLSLSLRGCKPGPTSFGYQPYESFEIDRDVGMSTLLLDGCHLFILREGFGGKFSIITEGFL